MGTYDGNGEQEAHGHNHQENSSWSGAHFHTSAEWKGLFLLDWFQNELIIQRTNL
jgi:hypothetical protein